jgi:hypothetical protein
MEDAMIPLPTRSHGRSTIRILPFAGLLLALAGVGCSGEGAPSPSDIPDPVFNDPVAKLQETGDLIGFSETLFAQYVHQEAALVDPTVTVFMAFFAGPNQRGLALSFLDTTNYFGLPRGTHLKARAIWIEGTGDWQYAAYRLANESERWSDRAQQEDSTGTGTPLGDQVVIHGQAFTDPFPVTRAQNAQIWANYSAAYAEMAKLFHARGLTVHARAFIQGASSTSAFWTECRTIRQLQASGDVATFRCASTSFPGYEDDVAWVECPAGCQAP